MQPRREAEAWRLVQSLLQGVLSQQPWERSKESSKQVLPEKVGVRKVDREVEIFAPGQAQGKMAIVKAVWQALEALKQKHPGERIGRVGRPQCI